MIVANRALELAQNQLIFGIGVGVANGMLAAVRRKRVSLKANLLTSAVVGLSEGFLVEPERFWDVVFRSFVGTAIGLTPFTTLETT